MSGLSFKTDMQFAYGEPSEMAPGVTRLVANNASPLTFKGTNTYIVGTQSLAVIDPGPEDPAHLDAILKAAAGRPITHILATHAHRDHVDGLDALRERTGAKTYAFPHSGRQASRASGEIGSEYTNYDFALDVALEHGSSIAGENWQLSALHTPGHAPDHLCFALEGSGVVFCGDHIMAWNTTVVAPPEGRMSDYIRSLELLLQRNDELFLPGHGGRITAPRRTVKAYLLHRRWRDQAILEAVRNGTDTVRKLLPVIYRDLDQNVIGAAAASLRAHIEYLAERGLVACEDTADLDATTVAL